MTNYYCRRCNEYFQEKALPNINKKHVCGELANVVLHERIAEEVKK